MTSTESSPLSDFPAIARDTIRYGDTDRQGHVNNAVYGSYYETGRVQALDRARNLGNDDFDIVLANISIDYLQEILWPGDVVIGTRVTKVGNSSVTFEQILTIDDEVRSRASAVVVKVDKATHRPTPLSDEQRSQFAALMTAEAVPTV